MLKFALTFFACALSFYDGYSLRFTNPLKPGKAVVKIGSTVKTLTRSTSCKARNWGNSQENSCTCCIVKYGLRRGGKFRYSGNHIKHCLKKKHCTPDSLNSIARSLGTSYDSNHPDRLTVSVITGAQVIPTIGTLGKEFHTKGRLNAQGAVEALSALARLNKIPGNPKEIKACLKASPLGSGGSQTLELFLVSQNIYCSRQSKIGRELFDGLYVVKGLGKGRVEAKNTAFIRKSVLGQYALSNPDRPAGFPSIALDEVSFSYRDHKGKQHYLAVLPLASGSSIFDILKTFSQAYKTHKNNGTLGSATYKSAENRAQHAMIKLGQQVGRLHVTYMTRDKKGRLTGKSRAVHGDMHLDNVFEDIEHNVVFIDAETFVKSLKSPRPIGKDLLRIYLFSTIRKAAHQNARKGNVGQTYWHATLIKPFLREYIRAYAFIDGNFNEDNFQDAMRILRRTFSLSGAGGDLEAVFLKAGPIRSLWAYRKYIRRILNELEKEIRENPEGGGLNPMQEIILKGRKFLHSRS